MHFDSDFSESSWVKIKLKGSDCLLCGPSCSAVHENNLRNLLKEIADKHQFSHTLVAVDFNYSDINWNNWSTRKGNSELFLECLRDCFWFQHVHDFTRYRHNQQPSVLGLIITNEEDIVLGLEFLPS